MKYLKELSKAQSYTVSEALEQIKTFSTVKFDESIDISVKLGIDMRQANQMVKGSTALPAGTGKTVQIVVFAEPQYYEKALKAGADEVGLEDLIKKFEKDEIKANVVIATPSVMAQVGRLGKILGPKGLMPNPSMGTVTVNIEDAVLKARKGQVFFKADKNGIINTNIGKVSFQLEMLKSNYQAVLSDIKAAKPLTSKGQYIKKISLSSTMGISFNIDIGSI